MRRIALAGMLIVALGLAACGGSGPASMRLATFNVDDVRTTDLRRPDQPRVEMIAEVIRGLAPDVLLLTEMSYDLPGGPGSSDLSPEGSNATRLIEVYLGRASRDGTPPPEYRSLMLGVNSGRASGRDFDGDRRATTMFPQPRAAESDGSNPPAAAQARAYALDAWGYGEFPGQRGMALLFKAPIKIDESAGVRTFRNFQWASMPDARRPENPATGRDFYDFDSWQRLPLHTSSAWLVPMISPKGGRFWVLCGYTSPTIGDGPEGRALRRRLDEIRFLGDVLDLADYIEDDEFRAVPTELEKEPVIVLADLGLDANEPASGSLRDLLGHPRLSGSPEPVADLPIPALARTDTAREGGRLDYALPSGELEVLGSGIYRETPGDSVVFPSDRFPVWIDVRIPR